jgi:hypothetical protein
MFAVKYLRLAENHLCVVLMCCYSVLQLGIQVHVCGPTLHIADFRTPQLCIADFQTAQAEGTVAELIDHTSSGRTSKTLHCLFF